MIEACLKSLDMVGLGATNERGTMKVEIIVAAAIVVFGAFILAYNYLPYKTFEIPTEIGSVKISALTAEELNTLRDCKKLTELIDHIKGLGLNKGSQEDILKKVDFELYFHSKKIIERLGTEHYKIIIKEMK